MGLLNIRSLRNKIGYISELLNELSLNILCLTETWLLESDLNIIHAALPKTHSIISVPRLRNQSGGGVAIVYSKSLVHVSQKSHNPVPHSFELLDVEFRVSQRKLRVAVVYRPGYPGTDGAFLEEFGEFLEEFSTGTGESLICGDFNYWIDRPYAKPYSSEFLQLTDQYGLTNHVTSPTHILGHTLDLVFTPVGCDTVWGMEVGSVDAAISDHSLITFSFDFPKLQAYKKTIKFRNYRNVDQSLALRDVDHCLRSIDVGSLSSDELTGLYNNAVKSVFDHHCPEVEKTIIVRDDSPWYSPQVKWSRRERRRAERKWRRARNDLTWSAYTEARRTVVSTIKREKIAYYQAKVESCGSDQKKLAMVVNNLIGKGITDLRPSSASDIELAEKFLKFFTNKITAIRQELDVSPDEELSVVLQPAHNPSIVLSSFHHVDTSEILSYMRNLKKTFCLLDPINVSKFTNVHYPIAEFISKIVNRCFSEGSFPVSEKRAILRPSLKKPGLDIEKLQNYRPVSNLSFLSKIIERTVLAQLLSLLQQNKIIPAFQSAYRQHHSTETALIKIHNDLVENTCTGAVSVLILLDLSAAFDTVDHELLLNDLYNSGVRDSALMLLKSYLSDRFQRVLVGQSVSGPAPLLYGVPQGSVLGPVLFSVYTSSLSLLLEAHGVTYHFYADDTQIYVKITNIADTKRKIELLTSDVRTWMKTRKLKLNESKTEILIIRGNRRAVDTVALPSINIGDSHLLPSACVRNLGVSMNSRLDFREHVNQIAKSCYFHIRNLYSVKCFITKDCLLKLVHSLIFSRVDYCNALLIGLPNSVLKIVQSVVNRTARLIFGVPPRTPTTPYLIELHWLPVKARIEFKLCLVTFKVLKFGEPKYLADLLRHPPARPGVAVRHDGDPLRLAEPRAYQQSSFFERSFAYMAPRLYNRLPLSVRQLSSIECFKRQLKTFLFDRSYNLERGVVTDGYRL